jgi:hypothetical protein
VDRPDGLIEPPILTRGWERTLEGIEDPLDRSIRRPLTFDAERGGPDVFHAHLGWRLVDQAQRLLRSALWGELSTLARVTGVSALLPDDIGAEELLVTALTRLVLVGADGIRLHEEVFLAARAVPPQGRSRRIEVEERRFEELRRSVEAALDPDACLRSPQAAARRLSNIWSEIKQPLANDVAVRAEIRTAALERDLARRKAEDLERIDAVIEHMRVSLSDALGEPKPQQLRFDDLDQPERRQLEIDRATWRARLDRLDEDREQERAAVELRYLGVRTLTFPVAVVLVTQDRR